MITPEQHAEIRRLYYGEHWKVGTIAAALGVHHDTVRAAIVNDTQGVRRGTCRATQLDPYLPFVRDTLAQYPRLRATRVFEMVKARGYTGSVVQLRRAVRLIRPGVTATVYRRLTTLAGEDYGDFPVMVSPEGSTTQWREILPDVLRIIPPIETPARSGGLSKDAAASTAST
jgi:hypothetical protein